VAFVSGSFEGSTTRRQVPVRNCRGIGLSDMVRNCSTGTTVVDSQGETVTFEGEPLDAEPASTVSLNRLYFL
jgi:urease alpha subunit